MADESETVTEMSTRDKYDRNVEEMAKNPGPTIGEIAAQYRRVTTAQALYDEAFSTWSGEQKKLTRMLEQLNGR